MLTDAGCKAGQGAGEQPWVSATTGVTSVPSKGLTWGAGTPTARPDVTSPREPGIFQSVTVRPVPVYIHIHMYGQPCALG